MAHCSRQSKIVTGGFFFFNYFHFFDVVFGRSNWNRNPARGFHVDFKSFPLKHPGHNYTYSFRVVNGRSNLRRNFVNITVKKINRKLFGSARKHITDDYNKTLGVNVKSFYYEVWDKTNLETFIIFFFSSSFTRCHCVRDASRKTISR